MDRSGRFNFWRVLVLTRAITPPRVVPGLWLQTTRWSWLAVFAVACLSVAALLHLGAGSPSSPPIPVSNHPSKPAAVKAASPKAPW
jgi:hypothetical protein